MNATHSFLDSLTFIDFLSYLSLAIIVFVFLTLAYGIIAIHDIPYNIAKARNHPHQDAIHAGGVVSLFTLHAIWPFLWIWATAYHPKHGYAGPAGTAKGKSDAPDSTATTQDRIAALEKKIFKLESASDKSAAPKSE